MCVYWPAGPTCLPPRLPARLPACRAHHSLEEFSIDELEKLLQVGSIMRLLGSHTASIAHLLALRRSTARCPSARRLVPAPGHVLNLLSLISFFLQVDDELEGLALDDEAEYQRFLQVRVVGWGAAWRGAA